DVGVGGDDVEELVDGEVQGAAQVDRAAGGQLRHELELPPLHEGDRHRLGDAVLVAELAVEHGLADAGLGGHLLHRRVGAVPADGGEGGVQEASPLGGAGLRRARRATGAARGGALGRGGRVAHGPQVRTPRAFCRRRSGDQARGSAGCAVTAAGGRPPTEVATRASARRATLRIASTIRSGASRGSMWPAPGRRTSSASGRWSTRTLAARGGVRRSRVPTITVIGTSRFGRQPRRSIEDMATRYPARAIPVVAANASSVA